DGACDEGEQNGGRDDTGDGADEGAAEEIGNEAVGAEAKLLELAGAGHALETLAEDADDAEGEDADDETEGGVGGAFGIDAETAGEGIGHFFAACHEPDDEEHEHSVADDHAGEG